jgi:hypothetical protein
VGERDRIARQIELLQDTLQHVNLQLGGLVQRAVDRRAREPATSGFLP